MPWCIEKLPIMMESGTKPISGEIESRAMTLASVGFVESERRKTYGDDAAIKQVTQFPNRLSC